MDIDIDFKTNFRCQDIFPQAIRASMIKGNDLVKHPCGFFFQNIAKDDITELSAIPYEEAEVLGFFKIDFLHLSLLDQFKSKHTIRELTKRDPNWDLLLNPIHVATLFQIHKNHSLLLQVKPRSVQELADVLALIRPGKQYLLANYLSCKATTRSELYTNNGVGYYFKKSHAIAYALTIVLQLHLIQQNL